MDCQFGKLLTTLVTQPRAAISVQLSQPRSLSLADRLTVKGALALACEISKIDRKKERHLLEYFERTATDPCRLGYG